FGAFGRDFGCATGERVMIVAITPKQWRGLLAALDIAAPIAELESQLGVSFARDEGLRFEHRAAIDPIVEAATSRLPYAELKSAFDAHDVCWGPYKNLTESLRSEPELSEANPMMQTVRHPSGHAYLTPGSPAIYSASPRVDVGAAPRLGQHTAEVLASVLGMADHEIGALIERGIVASAKD